MNCEGCGASALVMKSLRWRTGQRIFTLCDCCWLPLSGSLWIIRGQEIASARCDVCGSWTSPNDMAELRRGGRWDAFGGVCQECSE